MKQGRQRLRVLALDLGRMGFKLWPCSVLFLFLEWELHQQVVADISDELVPAPCVEEESTKASTSKV